MDSIFNFLEQSFNGILEVDWRCHLVVIMDKLRWVDETISLFQVHENLKCQAICILQEVIFKLGIVHVVKHFQHDAFEHLVYIDPAGVDTTKFAMHTSYMGSIHRVGACCNDGGGARIESLYPGRC
jgi:hypothetical protein